MVHLKSIIDSFKASVEEIFKNFFTEVFSSFLKCMVSLIAIAFLMYGIAVGIGEFLGGRSWLGFIVMGATILLGQYLFSKIIIFRRKRSAVKKIGKQTEFTRIDIITLTQQYPFYSTATAAVVGFMMAGGIKEPALDILKETIIALVKEQLASFTNVGESPK